MYMQSLTKLKVKMPYRGLRLRERRLYRPLEDPLSFVLIWDGAETPTSITLHFLFFPCLILYHIEADPQIAYESQT